MQGIISTINFLFLMPGTGKRETEIINITPPGCLPPVYLMAPQISPSIFEYSKTGGGEGLGMRLRLDIGVIFKCVYLFSCPELHSKASSNKGYWLLKMRTDDQHMIHISLQDELSHQYIPIINVHLFVQFDCHSCMIMCIFMVFL